MNILVGTSSELGRGSGIDAYVKEIVGELRRRGHDVLLVGRGPGDSQWLAQHGVPLLAVDQYSDPKETVLQLIHAVDEYSIDCIINNDNAFVQSIAPAVRCVFLSVAHLSRTSIATLAAYNHEWIDHLISISNDMRYGFLRRLNIPAWKVHLIYNGISDAISDLPRKSLEGPLRVVFSGGGSRRKGHDLVLRAIEAAPEKWKGIELSIYGDDSETTKRRLLPYSFVTVHGRVPRTEMLRSLEASHIFLLPSRVEGCPMALIEAMAYGLAPIVSDGEGAMDAMVTSGYNGMVCQLHDWPTQMLDCLGFYSRNRHQFEQHGLMARKVFLEQFKVDLTVQRLLDLANTPTVDRTRRADAIEVLKWHRPLPMKGKKKSPLIDRICVRAGWLRKHCLLQLNASS